MEWTERGKEGGGWGGPYAVVDDMLVPCIVVDVDCDTAEGGDFGGELGEAGVVLSVGQVGGVSGCEEGREDG